MEINPKLRSIELTKLLEKYARNTQEGCRICDNTQIVDDINLHQPSFNRFRLLIQYIVQQFESLRKLFELVQKQAYQTSQNPP